MLSISLSVTFISVFKVKYIIIAPFLTGIRMNQKNFLPVGEVCAFRILNIASREFVQSLRFGDFAILPTQEML